mgnify:CR=1 FL=1
MAETDLGNLRVAVVHDWLSEYAGSERVVEQMLNVFDQADVFTLVDFLPDEQRAFLGGRRPRTSYMQKLPRAAKAFRQYLALMPHAIEQFDLGGYDLVLSSSHAVAKGVITGPDQLHVCYCHTPIRYAWDHTHEYLRGAGLDRRLKGRLARWVLHYLRIWDARTAAGVDRFLANSRFIARRIAKTYRREAEVLYPPVDVEGFSVGERREGFYLAAGRVVPYKRTEVLVEAFSRLLPGRRLVVIGDGPGLAELRRGAGANVEFLGRCEHGVLRDHLQRARALVFAAREDFGILPVEAMACGTPVIAYGRGGARETVIPGQTGVLFQEQTPESLADGVRRFEDQAGHFDPHAVRRHAEPFSAERFRRELRQRVSAYWSAFLAERDAPPPRPDESSVGIGS